jgi:hypothetical protein
VLFVLSLRQYRINIVRLTIILIEIPSPQLASSYVETHKPLQEKNILILKKEIFARLPFIKVQSRTSSFLLR